MVQDTKNEGVKIILTHNILHENFVEKQQYRSRAQHRQ